MFITRKTVLSPIFFVVVYLISSSGLIAENRIRSVTNISFGAYQESDGQASTTGSELSITFKYFVTDQWAPFAKLGNGSAKGEVKGSDNRIYRISSSKTSLTGGIQWHYYIDTDPELTPYVGIGLSIHSYQYDFIYPASKIGNTSGIGYGPLLMFGVRVDISDHFLIIPGYQFEQVLIKTESGDEQVIVSSGFELALVLRF